MAYTDSILSLHLGGVRIALHDAHEDGSLSWRVEQDSPLTALYLRGTMADLRQLIHALTVAADEKEDLDLWGRIGRHGRSGPPGGAKR